MSKVIENMETFSISLMATAKITVTWDNLGKGSNCWNQVEDREKNVTFQIFSALEYLENPPQ